MEAPSELVAHTAREIVDLCEVYVLVALLKAGVPAPPYNFI